METSICLNLVFFNGIGFLEGGEGYQIKMTNTEYGFLSVNTSLGQRLKVVLIVMHLTLANGQMLMMEIVSTKVVWKY